MIESAKSKILDLRKTGKTYNEIENELGYKKSLIAYHCRINGIGGNGNEILNDVLVQKIREYYTTHTADECSVKFNVSKSSVIKYTENKRIILTDDERRIKNYERVKNHRQRLKEKAIGYKGNKCVKCGYDKCSWSFDFHHLNPKEKDFNFSSYSTLSWNKIVKELDKCILVCSNCHREIHYEEYLNDIEKRFNIPNI